MGNYLSARGIGSPAPGRQALLSAVIYRGGSPGLRSLVENRFHGPHLPPVTIQPAGRRALRLVGPYGANLARRIVAVGEIHTGGQVALGVIAPTIAAVVSVGVLRNSYFCSLPLPTSTTKKLGYTNSGSAGSIERSPLHGLSRTK